MAQLQEQIERHQREARRQQERAEGRDQVRQVPAHPGRIREDAPRHAEQAGPVHHEKGHVEAGEDQPESRLAQAEDGEATAALGKPVVHPRDHGQHEASDQHIVQMRDDEVRVVNLLVERHDG